MRPHFKLLSRDGAENLRDRYNLSLPTDLLPVETEGGIKYRVIAVTHKFTPHYERDKCQYWLDDMSFYHD